MRVLVAIANHGHGNDRFLQQLLAMYRTSRFDVHIVVLSDVPKDLGADVEVRVGLPVSEGWSLPFAHRPLFAERQDQHDLFIYSEDDTPVTDAHIDAFLEAEACLEPDEIPGFLRYEVDAAGEWQYECVHGAYRFLPETVCIRGERCFARFSNEHSACSVMSARHLKRAIESGGFVVAPHEGRYDLLCTGGNDIYTQCGLRRLVCVSEFERFSLHHLPNKYVGVFGISRRELALQAATLERLAGGQGWRGSLVEPETSTPAGSWWKNLYAPAQASLLELIPVSARRILVIGVGSGAAEAPLVKRADRVVVIPLDAVVGQGASWRGMEVLDGGLDAALRSLSSDRFDCLVFPWVLHLAADPVEWIRRCSALLEPEGTLVFSIPKMGDVSLRAPKLAPRPNGRYITRRWRLWTSLRRALQVRRWLRSAEFRVVETRSFELGLPDEPVSMLRGLWRDLLASGFVVCAKRRAAR